jgi:hypothetical protein
MKIEKIVVDFDADHVEENKRPPSIELRPEQGALIPLVGDVAQTDGFTMDVKYRRFTFSKGVLTVSLRDSE